MSGDVTDVDKLMESIEAPSPPREESSPEPQPEQTEPQIPEKWEAPDWTQFEWNGKKLAPDTPEKAKTWMSLGYNYSQRMGEFNKQRAEQERAWKEKEGQWQSLQRYAEIDKFAKQNPDWWKHVEEGWRSRGQQQQQIPDPIQQKLSQFEEFMTTLQQERQTEQEKQQDQALDAEIEAIRKDHPNIDLAAIDPATGEALELQILKHANQHGLPSFKAAFWNYLGPKLIADAKASGLGAATKTTQAQARAGVLGKTPAPVKGLKPVVNTKGSWQDRQFDPEEILKELANGG